jgi:hypothetical protein
MSKSILKARLPRSAGSQHSEESSMPGHSSTEGSDSDHSVLYDLPHDGRGRPDSTALHHVHFASDPSIYLTHSTADYDRTPMKVLKNPCAMPARGCPGLTYLPMEGAGGRQRGMCDLEHGPNGMEGSPQESSDGEEERTEEGGYAKGNGQARPCQRYALKVSAQNRRRKLSEESEGPFQLPGFRTLTGFSSLVTSPHDCLGGF